MARTLEHLSRAQSRVILFTGLCLGLAVCVGIFITRLKTQWNTEIARLDFHRLANQRATQLQRDLNRYSSAVTTIQESLSAAVSQDDARLSSRFHHLLEHHLKDREFRAVMDVGYARLHPKLGLNSTKAIEPPHPLDSGTSNLETDMPLSLPVVMRRSRWGLLKTGEDLLDSPNREQIIKGMMHASPQFSKLEVYSSDQPVTNLRIRGIRWFLPVYRILPSDIEKQIWSPSVPRRIDGVLYVTFNPEQFIQSTSSNLEAVIDVELFQGNSTREEDRLRGFPTTATGKPRQFPMPPSQSFSFSETIPLQVMENKVTSRLYATRAFDRTHPPLTPSTRSILLLGLGAGGILGIFALRSQCFAKNIKRPLPSSGLSAKIRSPNQKSTSSRTMVLPCVVGLLGTLLSIAFYQRSLSRGLKLDQKLFEMRADDMWEQLETRIERYEQSLKHLRDRFEFQLATEVPLLKSNWQQRLSLRAQHPGIIEVGIARVLTRDEYSEQHSNLQETIGTPIPKTIDTPHVILVLDDTNTINSTFSRHGENLYSFSPVETLALALAARDDKPRISIPMDLHFGADKDPIRCFRMYLPISANHRQGSEAHVDVGPAHPRPWGFVYATFSLPSLFPAIFGESPRDIEMEIFGKQNPLARHRLLTFSGNSPTHKQDHSPRTTQPEPSLTHVRIEPQYLQPWVIRFRSTSFFDQLSNLSEAKQILWMGFLLTAGLTGIVFLQARGKAIAERLISDLRMTESHLRRSIADRKQLSRDIHDESIQSLYAVSIGLKRCLAPVATSQPNAKQSLNQAPAARISQALSTLASVTAELRRLAWRANDDSQTDSLKPHLEDILKTARWAYGIQTHFHAPKDELLGSTNLIQGITAISTEAVSNAARHGCPSEISIDLAVSAQRLQIHVKDNGRGFDPSTPPISGRGISNMLERSKKLGGQFEIESTPGGPTVARFQIPFPEDPAQLRTPSS